MNRWGWMVLAVFLAVFLLAAWLADDAYITLRTVDNFVNGYGLRWNVAERVQSYTHPLWLMALVVVYVFGHNAYFTALLVSLAFSLATIWVILRSAPLPALLPGLGILLFSKAFVDFSVSGLENPATHLFLALFILLFLAENGDTPTPPRRLLFLGLTASLGILNRMDAALLYAPALLYTLWKERKPSTLGWLAVGFLPLLLWEIFSVLYYGFPFPNTAYAKLNTGIALFDLFNQALLYYIDSFQRDPITLATILFTLGFTFGQGRPKERLLALGIGLHLLYLFRTGGDFMSGRFFSAPLLASVLLIPPILNRLRLKRSPLPEITQTENETPPENPHVSANKFPEIALSVCAIVVALLTPYPTILPRLDQPRFTEQDLKTGINDERAFYYPITGLWVVLNNNGQLSELEGWVEHGIQLRQSGRTVAQENNIGFVGYYAGPGVYLVDIYGLGDPLLARLPIPDPAKWRIGHFERDLPQGYQQTLASGKNRLRDPALAEYYEHLLLITRGPLSSRARLGAIWKINTGQYDNLLGP